MHKYMILLSIFSFEACHEPSLGEGHPIHFVCPLAQRGRLTPVSGAAAIGVFPTEGEFPVTRTEDALAGG